MKKQVLIMAMILISKIIVAQDLLVTTIDYSQLDITKSPTLSSVPLSDPQRDKFKDKTQDKILLLLTNVPATATVTLNSNPMVSGQNYFDITDDIRNSITHSMENFPFKFKITDKAHPKGSDGGIITISWNKISDADDQTANNKVAELQSIANRKKIVDGFKSNAAFVTPYTDKNNRIDLYFDENGKLLNHLPINIDQNDIFYMHIVCVKGDEERYSVNVIEGDYAPSDLAIRPTDALAISGQDANNKIKEVAKEYTSVNLSSGPFTSDNFKFQISYDSSGTNKNGPAYNLKINKLYHVGIGVSFVSSNLKNPDFHVFYNGTDTTIKAFNNGHRTLFTVNAIWYWSILQQKAKGSIITGGRDILKDEPTFSIKRIFPTFGVTVDDAFKENFFLGGVYEFARGGNIIAGLHYGRVTQLADKNFILEKTKFSGTDADIQTDHKYKSGFFIGINLDTRIINAIFNTAK